MPWTTTNSRFLHGDLPHSVSAPKPTGAEDISVALLLRKKDTVKDDIAQTVLFANEEIAMIIAAILRTLFFMARAM